jgi:hypothetical protein
MLSDYDERSHLLQYEALSTGAATSSREEKS